MNCFKILWCTSQLPCPYMLSLKTRNFSLYTKKAQFAQLRYKSDTVLLAVSGTLQEGFPLNKHLDHPETKSIFVGWGLVRGVKSYFDIKTQGSSREFTENDLTKFPTINPCAVVTGNKLHANTYALYLVDVRAALSALCGEPRYLSITPDAVKVDLKAEETSENVRKILRQHIKESGFTNMDECAVLAVVSVVWRGPTFVENPVLYVKPDGTEVTNFHEGIAKWAGTKDELRGTPEYFEAIHKQIDLCEHLFKYVKPVYGTDKNTARFNLQMEKQQFLQLAARAGVKLQE